MGADHPDTLESASTFPVNLWALGQYEQARQLSKDALTRCRQVLGDDHPHTLESVNSLALSLGALGQYGQARQLGEDAYSLPLGTRQRSPPYPGIGPQPCRGESRREQPCRLME
ncbi:MAG TPA: tetratricopeptide repeat protein [Pseudonocardiaceae bacterium]|nr:tetratricopeptide repeat protein [Pseudonocardiaceae bacterium]